jgi:Cu-Zn family superoxide dismutase
MKILAAVLVVSVAATTALAAKKVKPAPVDVTIKTSDGTDAGSARLTQKGNNVEVKLDLKNLPAGLHGIHIHQKAACDAPDFKTAGAHFNPTGKQHGFDNLAGHHLGDFPQNLQIGMDHTLRMSETLKDVSLDPNAANSLTANGGTSIIIHEKQDDQTTDPSGNSGNRIACGVIQGQ